MIWLMRLSIALVTRSGAMATRQRRARVCDHELTIDDYVGVPRSSTSVKHSRRLHLMLEAGFTDERTRRDERRFNMEGQIRSAMSPEPNKSTSQLRKIRTRYSQGWACGGALKAAPSVSDCCTSRAHRRSEFSGTEPCPSSSEALPVHCTHAPWHRPCLSHHCCRSLKPKARFCNLTPS